ncbi:putative ferric reductase [Sphaerochaeta pleomorpha str. Grapes]|uniref:Putative ferric reductase n=2 Tax=Sphaerochaeta TaxID=399320 RepID=G8QUT7_SPHPG|nr:putative ferric reductase [Sphaerochaeta pleomorpha str. Grapes]
MHYLLLAIIYLIIPVLHFVSFLFELPFFGIAEGVNYGIAIMAFYTIFNHLLITVKLPLFQSIFPYDKNIKLHAFSGIFVLTAVFYHAIFKILVGKYINLISWSLLFLTFLLLSLSALWIDTPMTRAFRKKVLKGKQLSYDLLKSIHAYLFPVMGIFLYLHILDAGLLDTANAFSSGYARIFPIVVLLVVLFSKFRKYFLPLVTLTDNRQVGDISILTFTKPKHRKNTYKAGQFGYIQWCQKGIGKEEHPFSYLSCPSDESIMLGVKGSGDFTRKIATFTKGYQAKINGGFGNFIPNYAARQVVLIGSGIGIVPIISLIRQMKANPLSQKVICFLSVMTREELLLEKELFALQDSNLELHCLIFQEDKILYTAEFFKTYVKEPDLATYYICSSPNVRNIVLRELEKLEVSARQCHYEAFSY